MSVQREEYFASADALRATAILLVIFNHLFTFARPVVGHHQLEFGYLGVWGVNCFFLLSGCLLAGPFIRVLLDPARPWPSAREFYTRRFLRIYPLYLVGVSFTIAVMGGVLQIHLTLPAIVTTLLMLQNFSPDTIVAVGPPLWTMGIDAAFYIALPPVAFLLGKYVVTGSYTRRVKTVAASFAALIALCLAYRFCVYATQLDALSRFAVQAVYARNLAGMLTAFTLGAGLALFRIVWPRRVTPRAVCYAALGAGAAIAAAELLLRFGLETEAQFNLVGILRATVVDPIAAISCALVFFGLSQGSPPIFGPVVRSRVVKAFAAWAYAVYLVHYPIMALIHTDLLHGKLGLPVLVELGLLGAVVTLPVALCLHLLIERPFLALKNQHRDPPKPVAPRAIREVAIR